MKLYRVSDLNDSFTCVVKDDPVRPEIPLHQRVNDHSDIFILLEDNDQLMAAVCVKYLSSIPSSVDELLKKHDNTDHAIFYTIWSYKPGGGARLILDTKQWLEQNKPTVRRFVTLSPPTEMARRFHIKNGATVFRTNDDTVNYEYR